MYRVIDQHSVGEAITHAQENTMVYSLFRELSCPIRSSSFSIKYVVEGVEKYTINATPYDVPAGHYLLVNNQAEGKVAIGSKQDVRGLCINIKPELIAEAAASTLRPDTAIADPELGIFLNSADYPETQHSAQQTRLGQHILSIAKQIQSHPHQFNPLRDEQYLSLTDALLQDQLPLFQAFSRIPTLKRRTKKHLLQQVYRGRDFMDANYLENISIGQIAKEACMSEFHFFRTFKSAMGSTPYQYLLQKRLELAHYLLQKEAHSVQEVAILTGFEEVSSFSRAFRKHFNLSPGLVRR